MLVADAVVGNVHDDPELAERYDAGDGVETIAVDDTQRKRSRFRATTDAGTDVGVVLGDQSLQPGDVLHVDDDRLIAVEFAGREALVIDLADAAAPLTTAVELGHAVGNRHWSLAVDGDCVLVPVPDSRERLLTVVRPHLPAGATLGYDEVDPTVFDAAEGIGHDHGHSDDHGPGHDHNHDHSHDHDHGRGDGDHPGDAEEEGE